MHFRDIFFLENLVAVSTLHFFYAAAAAFMRHFCSESLLEKLVAGLGLSFSFGFWFSVLVSGLAVKQVLSTPDFFSGMGSSPGLEVRWGHQRQCAIRLVIYHIIIDEAERQTGRPAAAAANCTLHALMRYCRRCRRDTDSKIRSQTPRQWTT